MKVTFNKIPINTPEICGSCNISGVNCTCVCHVEAIVKGYHENIEPAQPLEIPAIPKQIAKATGRIYKLSFFEKIILKLKRKI